MTLVLENISLSVGEETVIDDVSLTLDHGSMNVLLGPILSGKTTLMRLIAGLDRPTTGRLIANGADVTNVSVRRRSVEVTILDSELGRARPPLSHPSRNGDS